MRAEMDKEVEHLWLYGRITNILVLIALSEYMGYIQEIN